MNYLVDTNVLLRGSPRGAPLSAVVRVAARKLYKDGHLLWTTPQNFVEFWNACTRPTTRNGFGLSPIAADRRLRRMELLFPLLADDPAVYAEWRRLVVAYGVSGVKVYDARLVAFMRVYGISHILTFNTADFVRYSPEGIVAVDPNTV